MNKKENSNEVLSEEKIEKEECECQKEGHKCKCKKKDKKKDKEEIENLNYQINTLKEALLRNQADLQNYKRRKEEENQTILNQ